MGKPLQAWAWGALVAGPEPTMRTLGLRRVMLHATVDLVTGLMRAKRRAYHHSRVTTPSKTASADTSGRL
ncbi:hypothetical protein GGE65_003544 [Skermanella aerolata]